MRKIFFASFLTACGLAIPSSLQAQGIWDSSYPRTWAPGTTQPDYHTLPFSHRYNYYSGPALYFGMNGRQAAYLEYLDRVDRAERMGRPIPPPPAWLTKAPPCRTNILRRPEPIQAPVPVEEPVNLAPTPRPVPLVPPAEAKN